MLIVVDKNFLERDELEVFLRLDPEHRAVLVDFVAIESYAGNAIKNMRRSMAILARYPQQVLVLKDNASLARLGFIDPSLRFDMVDWKQTRSFARFCTELDLADAGDMRYVAPLMEHAKHAQAHLQKMASDVEHLHAGIIKVANVVGRDALKARRENQPLPKAAGKQIVDLIAHLADSMVTKDGSTPEIDREFARARHYLLFRYATACVVRYLLWAQDGGASPREDKLRNDLVDLVYATAATYFDGLLTNDKRMQDIYEETRYLIERFFAPDG